MPGLLQTPTASTFRFEDMILEQEPVYNFDSIYFFPDGEVSLRAGDTYFRVHAAVLSRESTYFGRCPTFPSTTIFCNHADTCRTLLRYLYAKYPDEIFQDFDSYDEELDMIRLGCLAQLWEFPNVTLKAAMAIARFRYAKTEHLHSSINLPVLTRFAMESSLIAVMTVQEAIWKNLLEAGRDCGLAIQVAEQLHMHDLLGSAYYTFMLQGPTAWYSDRYITPRQLKRLILGWQRVRSLDLSSSTPILEHHPSCTQRDQCQTAWRELWKGTIQMIEERHPTLIDVREKLLMAQTELPDLELIVDNHNPDDCQGILDEIGMHPLCVQNAWAAGIDRYDEIVGGT